MRRSLRAPAVDAQLGERMPGVFGHGVEHVGDLEDHALEHGPRDVRARGAAREATEHAARLGPPPGRAEAGERGHEDDAAAVGHGDGEGLHLGRARDEAQPVAQPLHRRARHERTALERVGRFMSDLPGDRGEEPVRREARRRAGVEEHESAGSVGASQAGSRPGRRARHWSFGPATGCRRQKPTPRVLPTTPELSTRRGRLAFGMPRARAAVVPDEALEVEEHVRDAFEGSVTNSP
jgi:hypothetical protein